MAMGFSGSKGGINENERVDSEDSVDLFKDLVELNNLGARNGTGFVR